MAANTALTVTGLSFDSIRSNLRNFLSAKTEFKDYDFQNSAIGTLLDLLAYNTYMLAFYANMSTNEAFLDTAQRYDNVVSRAKMLGYRPISAQGATANVKIVFTAQANSSLRSLTVAKHTAFTVSVNGVSYTFVTPRSQTILANSTNGFLGYLELVEGIPVTHRWTYTAANTTYTIPNTNTDIRSLTVSVLENGNTITYNEATDLFTVNSSARVYYVDADRGGLYTVSFGDNVLGKKPAIGSVVSIGSRVCAAAKPNGANSFTSQSTVAGQSQFTLTTVERAAGGSEQETIESVRFNAPKAYETQHRGVTAEDYKRLVLQLNPDFSGVNAWGGEDLTPPIYGKVYLAVKPAVGLTISEARKDTIRTQLKRYNVQTISIEFTDPSLVYVVPSVTVHYDPNKTSSSASTIASLVAAKIAAYEAQFLNRFGGAFKPSRFLDSLDGASQAILGSALLLQLQKRFKPSTTASASYTVNFNHPLYHPGPGHLYAVSSTAFTYKGQSAYLDDDGYGAVRIYTKATDGTRVYLNTAAGTVDYTLGTVVLSGFAPTAFAGEEVGVYVTPPPSQYAVQLVKNQLLLVREATVSVVDDRDGTYLIVNQAVSTLGSSLSLLTPSYSSTITV